MPRSWQASTGDDSMENIHNIRSLGEYFDCIGELSQQAYNNSEPKILWFRGQNHSDHCLIPSIYRTDTRIEPITRSDTGQNYSKLHYAEDIRTQHYIAKNYHFFQKVPASRIEWLEVMQHHSVKTRALDWSESSVHSLLFAVEPFLDDDRNTAEKRQKAVPCVWVMDPNKVNQKIIQNLVADYDLCKCLVEELDFSDNEFESMWKLLEPYGDAMKVDDTRHMNNIFNLSTINDEILRDRSRLKNSLLKGDIVHPYFYLLSRIYSDGYILRDRTLPPIAVVHPYHSERIKAQKGVFSVFPFYMENKNDKYLREAGIEPNAFERNGLTQNCLNKLEICDPEKITYELMANGANISWLYPEMPVVSNEIENHRIY